MATIFSYLTASTSYQNPFITMTKIYYPFMLLIFFSCIFYQCSTFEEDTKSGLVLAQSYCSTCHIYPEPDLLDRQTWKAYVLPRMGAFMGIYSAGYERESLIEQGVGGEVVQQANVYPKEPLISAKDWEAIQQFYLSEAPINLPAPDLPKSIGNTSIFKLEYPEVFLSPPSTTFVELQENQVLFADANKGLLIRMDQADQILQQAKVGKGLVHLQETDQHIWATVMGSFSPTDNPIGYILQLAKDGPSSAKILIEALQRPVHSGYFDFNQDGLQDIVVSEYGKWTGGLSLHLQQKDGTFKSKRLINRAGAIKSEFIDGNKDGKMDILVLFGQGDEGFVLLENQGGGNFEQRPLLRFHPAMGSSTFSLFDWNKDGKLDILYTAGDNADYPPIIKPYHGVYIFEQQENFQFAQAKFLALPGAYGAIPGDFDLDGDVDLAAISFFPDYDSDAPIAFCLFERQEENFTLKRVNTKSQGRWLTMDAGDLDKDGDMDLILGSLTFEAPGHDSLVPQWVKNGLPFLRLENKTKP